MSSTVGTTSSGGVFIGGIKSGINTAALIDAAVAQKTRRADVLQVEIDENTAKIAAYDQLTTLTSAVDTALTRLRGPEGFFDDRENAFALKAGTVLTSDGSDFSSILDISIGSDAVPGTYEIEVLEVAKVQRVGSSNIADDTAALGYAGTFDLGLLGGGTANINITAGQSLRDIASAINALKDTSGVEASILKVSETEFQLILSGRETAKDLETFPTSGDDVLNLLGVSDGFGGFQNTLQAASGALIKFDGIEIRRDDNNFDDLVDGIELNIKNAAPGTLISLEVDNDVTSVKDAIIGFIEAYNAFRDFVVQNQQVDNSGNVAQNAILFSDGLLNGLTDQYSDLIGQNFGNGGVIQTIRDLGITIGNNNKLEITDEVKLDAALLNNFEEIKSAFASSAQTDNEEFRLTRNTSTISSTSITFDLTTDGAGTITGVTANGDGSAFTIDGDSVVGAIGGQFEGLRFTYVGTDANVTINADLSQGLADKIINRSNAYTDSVTGLIIREKASLQSQNREKTQDASDIIAKAEKFRQTQIEKYAKLEADTARLNVLLDQIRAILGNNDDD